MRPSFFDQKVLSAKTGTLHMIHTEDIIPKGGRAGLPVQTNHGKQHYHSRGGPVREKCSRKNGRQKDSSRQSALPDCKTQNALRITQTAAA